MKISLLDFIKTGKFANVELGQTMEQIKSGFAEPDDIWDAGRGIFIWFYGSLEFHFKDGMLTMIWCDWLEYINESKKFSLDLWVFDDLDKLTFPYFCSLLNKLSIIYTTRETHYSGKKLPDNVIINIIGSDIEIYFEDKQDEETNIDDYLLIAIGKSIR